MRRNAAAGALVALFVAWLIAAVGMRLAHVNGAEVEVDELQHLHAAWLVARGETPYADFFEHHTPLFYFLAARLIDPDQAGFDTILDLRRWSLGAHLLTCALGVVLASRAGAAAAVAAAVFLSVEMFSFAWGTLTFLDSFAAPFTMLACVVLAVAPNRSRTLFVAGILLGVAVLLTQKSVFATFAALGFAVVYSGDWADQPPAWKRVLWLAVGSWVPLALVCIALGTAGTLGLVEEVVLLNLRWKAERWPLGEAAFAATYEGPLWVLAGAALAGAGLRLWRREALSPSHSVPILTLAGLWLGVLAMPVVWYEYFVQIGPYVAVVAALTSVDVARLLGWLPGTPVILPQRPWIAQGILAVLVVTSVVAWAGRHVVVNYSPPPSVLATMALVVGSSVLVAASIRASRAGQGPIAAAVALATVALAPTLHQWEWSRRPDNRGQRAALELVHATADRTEPILDGYSGLGVFRPHAYRYWFLHDEIQKMVPAPQLASEVLTVLGDPAVRVVIRDPHFAALPVEVQEYVDRHFEPIGRQVWRRSRVDGTTRHRSSATGPPGSAPEEA